MIQEKTIFIPAKKDVALALLCFAALVIVLFTGVLRYTLRTAFVLDASAYPEPAPANFTYHCTLGRSGGAITLKGWACVAGERFTAVDCWAVLYDAAQDTYLRIPTNMELAPDATRAIDDGINYSFGGFTAFVQEKQLQTPFSAYEICFAYRSNGHNALVHTGQMLEGV